MMKTGEIFKAKVRDLSHKGLGVVEAPDSRVLFVPGAWPGDYLSIKITKLEKRFGFGEIEEILDHSEERSEVRCQHFGLNSGDCGGCLWMGIGYESQLRWKQKMLQDLLRKTELDAQGSVLKPIIPSPDLWNYRSRAQFKHDGKNLGFVSFQKKALAPVESCPVLTHTMQELYKALNEKLSTEKSEKTEGFLWNFYECYDGQNLEEIQANKRIRFEQANREQNKLMHSWLQERLQNCDSKGICLELFCGEGNFSMILSQHFKNTFAVELCKEALKCLEAKKIPGLQSQSLNLYERRNWKKIQKMSRAELLFLDPPREGFKELDGFMEGMKRIKEIIYVSCDPSTWSRDLGRLLKKGWSLVELQPFDSCPHTPKMELMSYLRRD